MKNLSIFLFITFLVTACSSSETETPVENLVISDVAKNIEAAVGNEFKIVINSDPSTGYHWQLEDDMDESIVQFVSMGYEAGGLLAPVAGGRDVWIFKALQPGDAHITLLYYSASNELVEPQQKLIFAVTVK